MEFNILLIIFLIFSYFCNERTKKHELIEFEINNLLINNLFYLKSWKISSHIINKIKIRNVNQDITDEKVLTCYKFNDIEIIIDNNFNKSTVLMNKKPVIILTFIGINDNNGFEIVFLNKKLNLEELEEISFLIKIINYNLLTDKQKSKSYDNLLECKNIINKISKNKYYIGEIRVH